MLVFHLKYEIIIKILAGIICYGAFYLLKRGEKTITLKNSFCGRKIKNHTVCVCCLIVVKKKEREKINSLEVFHRRGGRKRFENFAFFFFFS